MLKAIFSGKDEALTLYGITIELNFNDILQMHCVISTRVVTVYRLQCISRTLSFSRWIEPHLTVITKELEKTIN